MRETLVCQKCESEWSREPKRGRKPSVCPDCSSGVKKIKKVKKVTELNRSTYCSHSMHYMCSHEAKKFPQYLSCECKCHN